MNSSLRTLRTVVASAFFIACLLYLCVGNGGWRFLGVSERVQVIPSALAFSIGATGFWLIATFFLGRVYCSSVCPLGTLLDTSIRLRGIFSRIPACRKMRSPFGRRHIFAAFRYRHRGKWKGFILLFYVALLLMGLSGFAALFEPWNIFNLAAHAVNPEAPTPTKGMLFAGNAFTGAATGILILAALWIWALAAGRRFCTEICPLGTVLGQISERAQWQIEFDPDKCISCMKCEDMCKSECIKVVSRYVDNSRCVRCFDCVAVCPNNAIRFTRDRRKRSTPLLRGRAQA